MNKMQATIIIDEPKSCKKCRFTSGSSVILGDMPYCMLGSLMGKKINTYGEDDGRHIDCPLKEIV